MNQRWTGLIPLTCAVLFAVSAAQTPSIDRLEERGRRNQDRIETLEKESREGLQRNVQLEGRISRMEANLEALKASNDKIESTLTQMLLGIAALFVSQAVQFFGFKGRAGT